MQKKKKNEVPHLYNIFSLSPLRVTERKGGKPARRQYVMTPILHLPPPTPKKTNVF